jgi:hypothetical protein
VKEDMLKAKLKGQRLLRARVHACMRDRTRISLHTRAFTDEVQSKSKAELKAIEKGQKDTLGRLAQQRELEMAQQVQAGGGGVCV